MIIRIYNPGKSSKTVFFSAQTLGNAIALANITHRTMIFFKGLYSQVRTVFRL